MAYPSPPEMDAALHQLLGALEQAEKKKLDPLTAPWGEVEKGVIKLLGGPFQMNRPEHQGVALGLSAMFAARLVKEDGAFWFPNRESLEGAVIGFPDALMMLSPFGAVVEALTRSNLSRLDEVAKEIRTALAQVRFGAGPQALGQSRLSPLDYQRLFDPGFIQFVSLDPAKVKSTLESTPDKLGRDVRDALSRAGSQLPPEAKQQFEGQIVMALQRLEPSKPLAQQVERAPRVGELMLHLFGTTATSGSAPEEFWQDVVMPLLYIGAPASFPPLEPEEIDALQKGIDPLYLFLDSVPYASPAPEEGLLGAIALDEVSLPGPAFERVGSLRLMKIDAARLSPVLQAFDEKKSRDAVDRFVAQAAQKAPAAKPGPEQESSRLLDAAMALLGDLKKTVQAGGELHMRRTTEAEAASEPAIGIVRTALQGPRLIIL